MTRPDPGASIRERSRCCVVRCSHDLRNAILAIATRRNTTVGGLLRAALLLSGSGGYADLTDPGPGHPEMLAQIGRDGRVRRVRRHPTLHVRLSARLDAPGIRRLLAFVVALDGGADLQVKTIAEIRDLERAQQAGGRTLQALQEVAFQPLKDGVRSAMQASYVLGLPGDSRPDRDALTRRFRTLAPLFHPDTGVMPDSERFRQLVDARNLLLRQTGSGRG